jgi:hypothetical protein
MDSLAIDPRLLPALVPPALPPARPLVRLALSILGIDIGFVLSVTAVLLVVRRGGWECRIGHGQLE